MNSRNFGFQYIALFIALAHLVPSCYSKPNPPEKNSHGISTSNPHGLTPPTVLDSTANPHGGSSMIVESVSVQSSSEMNEVMSREMPPGKEPKDKKKMVESYSKDNSSIGLNFVNYCGGYQEIECYSACSTDEWPNYWCSYQHCWCFA